MKIDLPSASTVPYIEEWLGPWAMRPQEFNALAMCVAGLNVAEHLAGPTAAAARTVQQDVAEILPGGIALIEIRGRMQKQQASLGQSASTVAIRRAIRTAAADPQVGCLLIVADSPGGTVAGTEALAADIAQAAKQKPIIGMAEDLCASACYWALSQATRLYSNSTAMVGSIGTYGVVVDNSKSAADQGYKVHVVRAGQFKGAGYPGTEVTPEQLADYQREVDALNELFLASVAAGRRGSIDQVRALATGQVWIGQQAADVGLTDGVASFDQVLAKAQYAAHRGLQGKPIAATYGEIVALFPDASPEFICQELKAERLIEQVPGDILAYIERETQERVASAKERISTDTLHRIARAEGRRSLSIHSPN